MVMDTRLKAKIKKISVNPGDVIIIQMSDPQKFPMEFAKEVKAVVGHDQFIVIVGAATQIKNADDAFMKEMGWVREKKSNLVLPT